MNLVDYMTNNISPYYQDYYRRIYDDKVKYFSNKLRVEVNDTNDVIYRWKQMLYPSKLFAQNWEEEAEFYVLSFYLYNNRFIVKGHPFLLSKIQSFDVVSNKELRDATKLKFGVNKKGHVTYESRRRYIDELELVEDEGVTKLFEYLNAEIDSIVISKNSNFSLTSINGKLERIAAFFQHLMVLNDKYLPLYFNKIAPIAKDETNIRILQDELNVFLNDDLTSLNKRNSYSIGRKNYLLSYSLSILKSFKPYLLNTDYRYFLKRNY